MTIHNLINLLVLTLVISCKTQGQLMEMVSAKRGNTGYRGNVPKEERNKPIEGHDFYMIELKVLKKADIELVSMVVTSEGLGFKLMPVFEDKTTKMMANADTIVLIYAQKDDTAVKAVALKNAEVQLKIKVNGKINTINVKECQMILPQ
jgi:hypothetical protein